MPQINFDATNVPVAVPRTVLPAGDYLIRIIGSDLQETQAKNGVMLVFTEEVLEPPEARGRQVFDRLNIQNPNQTAQRIAQETLSAICHAVGKLRVGSSEELHGHVLCVTLGIEKDKDGEYEPKNRVKGYLPASSYKASAGAGLNLSAGGAATQPGPAFGQPAPFGPATAGAAGFPQQQAGQPFQPPFQGAATAVVGGQNPQNGAGGALPAGWGNQTGAAPFAPPAAAQGAPWPTQPAAAPQGWSPQAQQQPQQPQQQPQGQQPNVGWQPQHG